MPARKKSASPGEDLDAIYERAILDALRRRVPQGTFSVVVRARTSIREQTKTTNNPPKPRILRALESLVASGKVVKYDDGGRPTYAAASAARAVGAARVVRERCFFPSPRPLASTWRDIELAIRKRFKVVKRTPDVIELKWKKLVANAPSPTLRVEKTDLDTLKRHMRPTQWASISTGTPRPRSCVMVTFTDFEAALDEINTLIESQALVTGITKMPMYLAWTRKLVTVP